MKYLYMLKANIVLKQKRMDMSIKGRLRSVITLPLFLLAVVAVQFAHVLPASAAALTWTGGGDGVKFSDSANWSTGQVPVTGDTLTFAGIAGTTGLTLQNDLTNVTFAGVQLNPIANSTYGSTNYTINKLVLSDGATIANGAYPNGASNTITPYLSVTDLVGNGDLTVNTYLSNTKYTVAGDLTLGASVYFSIASSVTGKIIVNQTSLNLSTNVTAASYQLVGSYSSLIIPSSLTSAVTTPISVATGATNAKLRFNSVSVYDSQTQTSSYQDKDYTLNSPITLNANLSVVAERQVTARLGGQITANNYAITKDITSSGKLYVGSTEVIPTIKTTTITDSAPYTSVGIGQNETVVLDGERSTVSVYSGGLLKGIGKADGLWVDFGGIVAPGHSPGTITVASDVYIDGEYQAEILNKDNYDKIVAGEEYTGSYNAVNLSSTSKLNVVLPTGYSIKQGDQFTIIDNKSTKDVYGTFGDLAEGTQFTVNNVIFSITYKGGDGNDIVLTALNTGNDVGTPNTGAEKLPLANPVLVGVLGLGTAILLIVIALSRRKSVK